MGSEMCIRDSVLPIQASTNTHINVSLALPLIAGKGRSIQIDLSESTKTKVSKIREIRREATNAPSSLYPFDLEDTAMTATFLPFIINPVSAVDVFPVYPTQARTSKAIGLDLKQHVKSIINNVVFDSILWNIQMWQRIRDSMSLAG